ncbi:MAG: chromate transporter [Epulopiscium sp. Nele67-Bin005]|nr:MAG: chromate transporter [Epulopiscium sp. Nele67-Bin005]
MKELFDLFKVFFRIGGCTFGGGYAMLPMLQKEVVEKYKWATEEEIMDYFAIGQMTPGIIAVNTATFIGYKYRGVLGALFATLGIVTPSIIIITLIATIFDQLIHYSVVQHAFEGIRIVVIALIGEAVYKLSRQSVKSKLTLLLFVMALVIMVLVDITPIAVICVGAIVGVISNSELPKGDE